MAWLPKRVVVVPYDFSEPAHAVLQTALELVSQPAQLHVIHVLPPLEPADPGVIWSTVSDDSRRHHAEQALAERLQGSPAAGATLHVAIGDPGREITDLAAQLSAELIVLSSHGRTGLARLLIGSVAERVTRLAHCPVLVQKG